MPGPAIAIILTVAILVMGSVVYLVGRGPARPPEATPYADIRNRIAAEDSLRIDSWDLEPTHRVPDVPFTVHEAHAEMRRHIDCGVDFCPRKRSAQAVLINAGKIRVDLRVGR